ncbi:hypothetical protein HNQ91_002535 [Filimonas zeae]|uniref:Membrane protein n=1 Tax=Filimonas zeae TaxID=1737353 RepID=A0A917ITW1_9BACT|nr:RagB/SusD family nutrient uptake outer membrane protein [Filimonas zeae]MDR6339484.1 hypothetical protein [Filimonas zeae]GGH63405.1 membrane protein [Filimonas zeae]
MRKRYYTAVLLFVILGLTACNKYTDINPKGKNLLNTAAQLEYLLNYSFNNASAFDFRNMATLDNDSYVQMKTLTDIIKGTKDWSYVLTTYDTTVDRAALATTDGLYSGLYSVISTRLNVILQQAAIVTDNPAKVRQLQAEAYILRAYLHYLLVNVYAKAYDPATAASDGGIAYMDKINFDELAVKSTVQQVYNHLLADVDAAFALNALPEEPVNTLRAGKGFAFAVKARILLSMRNYTGALAAADSALLYNNRLEDHVNFLSVADGGSGDGIIYRDGINAADNYFYAVRLYYDPSWSMATAESSQYYEPGNIMRYYTDAYDTAYGLEAYTQTKGTLLWYSFDYQSNASGLTTSDAYLIKAECLIRAGKIAAAMDVLNAIRVKRIRPADYQPLTAADAATAMNYLKRLSRTEFMFSWKNFVNLKRWNTEPAYSETITRTVTPEGSTGPVYTYTLKPGSKLWIFPFPQNATNYNLNLTQNY